MFLMMDYFKDIDGHDLSNDSSLYFYTSARLDKESPQLILEPELNIHRHNQRKSFELENGRFLNCLGVGGRYG